MRYNLLYTVAEEVSLKTRGVSGKLTLLDDHLDIEGPDKLSLPYSDIEDLRIFRQHKVGTLIHVLCADVSVFFAVPHFNLFGVLAIINYSGTRALFDELQRRTSLQSS